MENEKHNVMSSEDPPLLSNSPEEYPSERWEPGWFNKVIERGAKQYKQILEILEEDEEK